MYFPPKSILVVDLDGTLCDVRHRLHLAQASEWDEFHNHLENDVPIKATAEIVGTMSILHEIVIATGRNERYRLRTVNWLNKHHIRCDALLMRPDDNYESDHLLKPRMLLEYLEENERKLENIIAVIDDRDKVVAAWREMGLVCLQPQEGAY